MELVRQKNVASYITFPIVDADGDTVTSATGLDSEIDTWSDGAAPDGFTDCTNEATEIGATGVYYLSLTAAELNADYIYIQVKTTSSGAKTQHIIIRTMVGDPLNLATTGDGEAIWTAAEKQQIRKALGIDGAKSDTSDGNLDEMLTFNRQVRNFLRNRLAFETAILNTLRKEVLDPNKQTMASMEQRFVELGNRPQAPTLTELQLAFREAAQYVNVVSQVQDRVNAVSTFDEAQFKQLMGDLKSWMARDARLALDQRLGKLPKQNDLQISSGSILKRIAEASSDLSVRLEQASNRAPTAQEVRAIHQSIGTLQSALEAQQRIVQQSIGQSIGEAKSQLMTMMQESTSHLASVNQVLQQVAQLLSTTTLQLSSLVTRETTSPTQRVLTAMARRR